MESLKENGDVLLFDPLDPEMAKFGTLHLREIHYEMVNKGDAAQDIPDNFEKSITLSREIGFTTCDPNKWSAGLEGEKEVALSDF